MSTRMDQACYNILSSSRHVEKGDLDRILREAGESKVSFAVLVVRSGLLTEADLLRIFSKNLGMPFINLKSAEVDASIFEKVPIKFAEYYKFFPLKLKGRQLTIAVSQLLDVNTLDEMRLGLGYDVQLCLAVEQDIEDMLKKHYGLGAGTASTMLGQVGPRPDKMESLSALEEVEDIEKLAETASVGQLVNQILLDAYKKRASDIHIEPFRGRIRIRYRVDGTLQEAAVSQEMKRFILPILSRIKIMANLNIVEHRLPQDGKARVKTQSQALDLRVSSIPTPHGESLVIRILPGGMIFDLDKLGLDEQQAKTFRTLVRRPYGILFVTGPTGSGKSTTLYAGLSALNAIDRKIVTIEDPVEYELEGVTQIQVSPDVGLTFARGLRSMLRHDPDVMMVGEVRDLETADIAIRVALTGHLVLSTLHTNDAASGVTRLLDMGVEPFLVSSSVNAFIAQRLVRKICTHCRTEDKKVSDTVKQMIRRDLHLSETENPKLFIGKGCDECQGSGYVGRAALQEMLIVNEEIRKLIFQRASADDIKASMKRSGARTLRQDGWVKVLKGLTTPNEILDATPGDEEGDQAIVSIGSARLFHGKEVTPAKSETQVPMKKSATKKITKFGLLGERRRFKRFHANLKLTFRGIDIDEDLSKGITRQEIEGRLRAVFGAELSHWETKVEVDDISPGGLSFIAEHGGFESGVILDLHLDLPDGQGGLEALGRISRVGRMEKLLKTEANKKASFKIGVSFLAIKHNDRVRIEEFCGMRRGDEKI